MGLGRRAASLIAAILIGGAVSTAGQPAQAQGQGCGDRVVIGFGDTISSIARRCGLTVADIMAANPLLPNPNFVFPGLRITLPPPQPSRDVFRYVVRPGDTLLGIARANGLALSEIYRLNPDVDARSLRAGDLLLLPGGVASPPPPVDSRSYVVRPGDTLFSIARANGMTVRDILDLNPHLDPRSLRVGEVVLLRGGIVPPPPLSSATARVTPSSGAPGTVVEVSASGFRPSTTLNLLVGSDANSLQDFEQVGTDRNGNATLSVRIPGWAAARGTLVFAFEAQGGRVRALSNTFRVTRRRSGEITVEGTLTREGVECQAMRGDDGKLYTLAGDLPRRMRPGDRMRVTGRVADVSFCQQGTTIDVESATSLR